MNFLLFDSFENFTGFLQGMFYDYFCRYVRGLPSLKSK